ncbi:hypothetical protein [Kitasatospora sp. NBC_01300]|uniref:hypothetical protein n=1 Tax=Kitasatospora sp. NBC_01300 TaxID=2903574 RepID=UPI002F910280|nr:hypothetical protein OG556_40820 [Kitasatospora sp. NBC_01300]
MNTLSRELPWRGAQAVISVPPAAEQLDRITAWSTVHVEYRIPLVLEFSHERWPTDYAWSLAWARSRDAARADSASARKALQVLPPLVAAALADPELEDDLTRLREAALAVQAGHAYGRVMQARQGSAEAARKLREADVEYRAFGRTEREGIDLHLSYEARRRAAWGR